MLAISVILSVLLTYLTHAADASEPVFAPEVVRDATGNRANRDSVIRWSAPPRGGGYRTENDAYHADGLQALFDFANDFIDTVQPNDFPYGECGEC